MNNENIEIIENEEIIDTDESVEIDTNSEVDIVTETVIEYVYIKENRPLFETPLSDYSVTEGLLLLIFVVIVLNNVFKSHIKG